MPVISAAPARVKSSTFVRFGMPEYLQRYADEPPLFIDSEKRRVRILRPWEYASITRASASLDNQTRLDVSLLSRMRVLNPMTSFKTWLVLCS